MAWGFGGGAWVCLGVFWWRCVGVVWEFGEFVLGLKKAPSLLLRATHSQPVGCGEGFGGGAWV